MVFAMAYRVSLEISFVEDELSQRKRKSTFGLTVVNLENSLPGKSNFWVGVVGYLSETLLVENFCFPHEIMMNIMKI